MAHRLEKDNRDRVCQVQAPRPLHGNREQLFGVSREQRFGEALRFASENQKISWPEADVVVGAVRFRREKKQLRVRVSRSPQVRKGIPKPNIYFLPVIEPSALKFAIVDRESKRLDQVKSGTGRETKPADVARVRRNLGLDQDDVEHRQS